MFQENSIETCILSRVKQITGPGWMHETGARTWYSGRTWRERVGREVGGGIGMGKTCEPKAFSFQCMTKFTTNKKKKKKLDGIRNQGHLLHGLEFACGKNHSLQYSTSPFFFFFKSILCPTIKKISICRSVPLRC